jgi:hypothetical protein
MSNVCPVPFDRLPRPRGYVCCRAPYRLPIDGSLTDPAWEAIPWTEDFVDIEGDVKPLPRFRTRVKMLWDDDFFYIGAELEEPDVWATLVEHDSIIFHDNDFEVFIDPNGDNHDYYEVEINALNTVWDLRLPKPYRDGGPALNEWEIPGLKTAIGVRGTLNEAGDADEGWTVEIALPWSVLAEFAGCPTPPRAEDQWRVNFSRVEWTVEVRNGRYEKVAGHNEDNWVWSPQGVVDMHRPEVWGYVQFSDAPPGADCFRPDPSWPARVLLHKAYYAQRAFREERGRWAESTAELGCDPSIAIRLTPEGYVATAEYGGEPGETATISIRQDSRVEDSANCA